MTLVYVGTLQEGPEALNVYRLKLPLELNLSKAYPLAAWTGLTDAASFLLVLRWMGFTDSWNAAKR